MSNVYIRSRKPTVINAFSFISQASIVSFVGLVLYADYLMIAPYLSAVFWAFIFAQLLYRPQQRLMEIVELVQSSFAKNKKTVITVAISSYFLLAITLSYLFAGSGLITHLVISLAGITGLLLFVLSVLFSEPSALAATSLTIATFLSILIPFLLFTISCVTEIQTLAGRVSVSSS